MISRKLHGFDSTVSPPHPTHNRFVDRTGHHHGLLTVLHYAGQQPGNTTCWWWCRCTCGQLTVVRGHCLNSNNKNSTQSCGCLMEEARHHSGAVRATHGQTKTKLYRRFRSMHQRCEDPNGRNYANYGGRGITVDPRWDKFENFVVDMGACPPGMMIERRDNNLGYSKENCYWATPAAQNRNKRPNVWLIYKNHRFCLKDWSDLTHLSQGVIRTRLRQGWTHEQILTTSPDYRYKCGNKLGPFISAADLPPEAFLVLSGGL